MIIFTKTTNDENKGLKLNVQQFKDSDLDITDEEIEQLVAELGDLDGILVDAVIYGMARMYDFMLDKIYNLEFEACEEKSHEKMIFMKVIKPFIKDNEYYKPGVICGTDSIDLAMELVQCGYCRHFKPEKELEIDK